MAVAVLAQGSPSSVGRNCREKLVGELAQLCAATESIDQSESRRASSLAKLLVCKMMSRNDMETNPSCKEGNTHSGGGDYGTRKAHDEGAKSSEAKQVAHEVPKASAPGAH